MTLTGPWPASSTLTVPPKMHEHVDDESSAATPFTVTCDEPGVHGLSDGTHVCGVSVPPAALVADATCGFASDVQSPNVGTFPIETSSTTPDGFVASTSPDATNVAASVPDEHFNDACADTWVGIDSRLPSRALGTLTRGGGTYLVPVNPHRTAALTAKK